MSESKNQDHVPWMCDLMELLSYDLTCCFTRLLRVQDFYSEDLKTLARASLPPLTTEGRDVWTAEVLTSGRPFMHKVVEAKGESVLGQMVSWLEARYPVPRLDTSDDLTTARWALSDLTTEWNDHPEQAGLPLNRPQQAELRMAVRDYVTHTEWLHFEIDQTNMVLDSEWDRKVSDIKDFEDWPTVAVSAAVDHWEDHDFWDRLAGLLSPEEARELLEWMVATAKPEKQRIWILCRPWKPPSSLVSRSAASSSGGC